MIVAYPQLISLCLLISVISVDAGRPGGLEFKKVKFCEFPHDETARVKISPWPFIPSGKPGNITITFTPAVDVFAATLQYEVKSDGHIVARGRDNVCHKFPELCSLPAGETYVWTYSDVMRAIPPGFKMTIRGVVELYNEERVVFVCLDVVATIH
ncbi:hypothetical protein OS493_016879 [Desmophyllum pertusum]|uniref:MD-2-related lipid-recognition domain-containing protein n=1 Tax=Desmophyllum pertusum TaxID=174260 RepID=A0A9X0CMF9_9CNID|nr:hypothetical protein OS493_016879 [Desmophyllum pertusum]